MSEITELANEIKSFRKEFGEVTELTKLVSGHHEFIKTYRNEVETINKTLYNDKDGMVSRIKGVETILKGRHLAFGRTTSVLTLFFMGGMFVMWVIRTLNG